MNIGLGFRQKIQNLGLYGLMLMIVPLGGIMITLDGCSSAHSTQTDNFPPKPGGDILVWGDSTTNSIVDELRLELTGLVNIVTISEGYNIIDAGSTLTALQFMDEWLDQWPKAEFVLFNHGLWDASDYENCYLVPPADYLLNIEEIVARIIADGKTPIFKTTHLTFEDSDPRAIDIVLYNAAAARAIYSFEMSIVTIDLEPIVTIDMLQADGIHYTDEGEDIVASFVADRLVEEIF